MNFKHYLNSISRSYDWIYNVIGCVLVPVYMAIMSAAWSMFMAIFNEKVELAWMIFIGLIMGIVFGVLSSAIFSRKKHFFYEDYMEILRSFTRDNNTVMEDCGRNV